MLIVSFVHLSCVFKALCSQCSLDNLFHPWGKDCVMIKISVAVFTAVFAVASLSGCANGIGKGKGKAPPPVVEPAEPIIK
jgi:hypothetical protein